MKHAVVALLLVLAGMHGSQAEVTVDVLGAGGPEITDGRASTSYLVSVDDRALLLVDTGPGSALAFEGTGADFSAIQAILYTHLHVDHSADLPAYVKGAYFIDRRKDLPVFGPDGNHLLPPMDGFLSRMFGSGGVYPYLSEYLPGGESSDYRLLPTVVPTTGSAIAVFELDGGTTVSAVAVEHGPLPALAWRVDTAGCAVTFTGDGNGDVEGLSRLARGSDLLVAHLAINDDAGSVARNLHMPPPEIGRLAAEARVGRLLLAHRMRRTDGREEPVRRQIGRYYDRSITLATDGSSQVACP